MLSQTGTEQNSMCENSAKPLTANLLPLTIRIFISWKCIPKKKKICINRTPVQNIVTEYFISGMNLENYLRFQHKPVHWHFSLSDLWKLCLRGIPPVNRLSTCYARHDTGWLFCRMSGHWQGAICVDKCNDWAKSSTAYGNTDLNSFNFCLLCLLIGRSKPAPGIQKLQKITNFHGTSRGASCVSSLLFCAICAGLCRPTAKS